MKEEIEKLLKQYLHDSVVEGENEPLIRRSIRNNTIDKIINLHKKEQKANIEQAMVYLYRQLPEWIMPKPRYMSKARKDSLWSHMCMWIDEYKKKIGYAD